MNHLSYIIIGIISITGSLLYSIPNYWDPKNIISAKDPYWFFHYDGDLILLARYYPAVREQLLKEAAEKIAEYKKGAYTSESKLFKDKMQVAESINVLENNYQALINDLQDPVERELLLAQEQLKKAQQAFDDQQKNSSYFPPCKAPLTHDDRKELKDLIDKQPKDILLLTPEEPDTGGPGWAGAILPNMNTFERWADAEQRYDQLKKMISSYATCPHLSKADKTLIDNARKSLDAAYKTVVKELKTKLYK